MSDPLVGGRFRLIARLGQGQTGHVWQAVDEQTGGMVAVKLQRGRPLPDIRFDDPHIVAVYHTGMYEGGGFAVMELVDGVSLATVLADEGTLSIEDATTVAIGVCLALDTAHAAGVVHGNLKSSNVLITEQGVIKVGDLTGVGTPREDMYALGLLMEAMSGRRDPVVERLLSREPYSPAQLLEILTGTPAAPGSPGADGDHEDDVAGRPRLARLAVITGAATLAIVIAVCVWFLRPATPPDLDSQGPLGGATTSPSELPPSAETSASPETSRPPAAAAVNGTGVNAVKAVVADQLQAGQIQPEAAAQLNARLDEIGRFQARGQTKQANDRIAMLKSQLSEMRRENKVTADGYNAILAAINKI